VSGDWIALLVYFGIGAVALDADGWENVLFLLGLIFVCAFPIWLFSL
jgi:hypothetical protein